MSRSHVKKINNNDASYYKYILRDKIHIFYIIIIIINTYFSNRQTNEAKRPV